jgi:hypothetical protein
MQKIRKEMTSFVILKDGEKYYPFFKINNIAFSILD